MPFVNSQFKPPVVKVSKVFEIYSPQPDGIEIVKKAILDAISSSENKVKIQYISSPRYRITCYASNYKDAEKSLKKIFANIEKNIRGKGNFRVIE